MGLLGDMAKAAAKVAINQVSNTAHEKVSERSEEHTSELQSLV